MFKIDFVSKQWMLLFYCEINETLTLFVDN